MPGLYDDAEVYDILHEPGTEAEARGLLRIARRFGACGRRPAILEPACGTGRFLRALARLGCSAIGFDRSPAMVAYARARLADEGLRGGARVFRADLTSFAARVGTRTIDAAFTPINTIRHLPSDAAMLRHFAQIRRVLRPRGIYVVGLSLSLYGAESPSKDVWTASRGRVRVTQIIGFLPFPWGRREWAHSHLVVRRGRRAPEEHRDSKYWLRCYSRGQWESLLSRAGFATLGIVDESGHDADPGDLGYALWVLRPLTRSGSTG